MKNGFELSDEAYRQYVRAIAKKCTNEDTKLATIPKRDLVENKLNWMLLTDTWTKIDDQNYYVLCGEIRLLVNVVRKIIEKVNVLYT